MHYQRQDAADAKLSLDVRRVAWKVALHCQKRLAAQDDRILQEQPVFLADVTELGPAEL